MGWLDCLKPASFNECNIKNIPDYYWNGVKLILGVSDNAPEEDGDPDREGLLGLENEFKFAGLILLGAVVYRVVK